VVDKPTAAIFLLVLAGGVFLNISPVWFVIGAALVGILLKNLEVRGK
jgi:chromate transporter